MLFYNDKKNREEILQESKELEEYKNSYSKKIILYKLYRDTMNVFKDEDNTNEYSQKEIENKINTFQNQINIINSNLELLYDWEKEVNENEYLKIDNKTLNRYNQKNEEIKKNYISNSVCTEQITANYIDSLMNVLAITIEKNKEDNELKKRNLSEINDTNENDYKIKNNDTLLISESTGKVTLPYTAEEVLEIFNNEENQYNSAEDVIQNVFTRNFSDYKIQFASRYRETMKLAREKEKYNLIDSITIATEMMKTRFLHPAIISACRSINELDVYLDCLEKNELDDFKIFKIKYELCPIPVKQKKDVIGKNRRKRGKRYINNTKHSMWSSVKRARKAIDEFM